MSINFSEENDIKELDRQLRPESFNEYIGQENIKKNLKILIDAAKQRGEMPEHLLFYGPPGIGKTTIAKVIANEMGANLKIASGSSIEKVADLAAILTNLEKGDILFIDEVHRLKKPVEEVLYPAMESYSIDIMIGKGPSARIIQMAIEPFTLICATTLYSKISSPLRSRFSGGVFHLGFYTKKDIENILKNNAEKLNVKYKNDAIEKLALHSRNTPRFANYLLKRVRDYIQINNKSTIDKKSVEDTLKLLEIYDMGLTKRDMELLYIMNKKFNNLPVGIKTLATALSEEEETIEQIHEPYLIQIGFIEKTPKGRRLTKKAIDFLQNKFL